jgi:hypothetical protein
MSAASSPAIASRGRPGAARAGLVGATTVTLAIFAQVWLPVPAAP